MQLVLFASRPDFYLDLMNAQIFVLSPAAGAFYLGFEKRGYHRKLLYRGLIASCPLVGEPGVIASLPDAKKITSERNFLKKQTIYKKR